MNRYAIVRDTLVENVVLWDGVSSWTPPAGTQAINVDNTVCGPGFTFDGTAFTPPVEEQQPNE